MRDIMIDLETLGKKPYSVFPSFAAVPFNLENGDIGEPFSVQISLDSAFEVGLQVDASTIEWWLSQNHETRKLMFQESMDIYSALLKFAQWFEYQQTTEEVPLRLWGNSASFDLSLLGQGYEKAGIEKPWKYKQEFCYRTLVTLYPDSKPTDEGVLHSPADDAIWQVKRLHNVWVQMNRSKFQDTQFVEDYSQALCLLHDVVTGNSQPENIQAFLNGENHLVKHRFGEALNLLQAVLDSNSPSVSNIQKRIQEFMGEHRKSLDSGSYKFEKPF